MEVKIKLEVRLEDDWYFVERYTDCTVVTSQISVTLGDITLKANLRNSTLVFVDQAEETLHLVYADNGERFATRGLTKSHLVAAGWGRPQKLYV